MDLFITEQARAAIGRAVRDGQRADLELGGSLLAHETEGRTLVAYAVPTGPSADRGPGHVRTDASYQNTSIEKLVQTHPSLTYVGDWHVHPMWLPHLSQRDRMTARAMLLDEASRRDHLVLLLGTPAPGTDPVVLAFVVRLEGKRGVSVRELPLKEVADDSQEVREALGTHLEPIDLVLHGPSGAPRKSGSHAAAMPAAPDTGFSLGAGALETPALAVRIQRDLDELRRELGVAFELRSTGDALGALIRRDGSEAVVLFPPEYPLGAPQVFAGSLDDGPLDPVPLLFGWSSLHRLVEPVAEALDRAAARRAPASWLARFFRWPATFFPASERAAASEADARAKPASSRPKTPSSRLAETRGAGCSQEDFDVDVELFDCAAPEGFARTETKSRREEV